MHARLAWTVASLTLLIAVVDISITSRYRSLLSEEAVAVHGFPFLTAAVVGSAVMGALIVSRSPRHRIGWLLSLVGFFASVSLLAEAYSVWVITADGPGSRSLGGVAGWLSALLGGQLSMAAMGVMFLLAPDGQFLSGRWRLAALLPVVGAGCYTAGILAIAPTRFDTASSDVRPVSDVFFSSGILLIAAGLVAGTVSLVLRLRRSAGVQRQQLRLIAASGILVALGLCWLLVVQTVNGGAQTWTAGLPLFVSYFFLPILFAVAVLRYRLYHIELIINRAIVLAVGTAFAAIGYAALVVAVAGLVNTQTDGFWVSLIAISLVALAFQPLRRRVVRLANRLAYGPRALPYEELADFSRRLAELPSPRTLLPAVAEAAGRAVSAQRSTATLQVAGSADVSHTWPAGGPAGRPAGGPEEPSVPGHRVFVRDGTDTLGSIDVVMPRGRGLRAADQRLLQDLADQTAVAFKNAVLAAELAEHVAALDRTTEALVESRRRIIAADDAARRQLESAISREVLPHLETMPAQLERLGAEAPGPAALDELEQLVTRTNQALESLREQTRGVFPTQLARAGLSRALSSHLGRTGAAIRLSVEPSAERRFAARVEAAAYFACVEAVHAGSGAARVEVSMTGPDLVVRISGLASGAVDLQAIADRVEAVGGSPVLGDGVLTVRIPVGVGEPEPTAV